MLKADSNVRLVRNVSVKGVACAVPPTVSEVSDLCEQFGQENVKKIMTSTGVERRHVVTDECSSDLCVAAAERMISDMQLDRASIDTLIFVSQTHDYTLPATACVLQQRLGLPVTTAAFDIAMGCSGYVYGMWMAASLLSGGGSKRALLLVGDTISKIVSVDDRAVAALFGDAGSATLLDYEPGAPAIPFVLGTDGRGAPNLIVPGGAFRDRAGTLSDVQDPEVRSAFDLYMNGAEIFAFTLARVPALVAALHESVEGGAQEVDRYVFHQANKFMLEHLVKRMKLDKDKVVLDVQNVGNTSCTSIPLALVIDQRDHTRPASGQYMLAGFGVGYSWAGCVANFDGVHISPLVVMQDVKMGAVQ